MTKSITSFDVFDTVVMRSVSRPSAIFLFAGHSAPASITPTEFAHFRAQAEREAEQKAPGQQPTFDEIHEALGRLTNWSERDLLSLKEIERALELRLSHGVPETLKAIENARKGGKPILFISDMYLPAITITELLVKCGAWVDGDRIYVSCEARASKRHGGLFTQVLSAEGLEPSQLRHTGDNKIGDVQKPREMGIEAKLVAPTALNPYEQVFDRHCEATNGITALLAGTGCAARLQSPKHDAYSAGLETVACSVVAPILTAFAGWTLEEAAKRGIKRLYFVARDGYVIKQFAEALTKTMPSPPEIRYLYGSRQAWRSVSLKSKDDQDISWAFESTESVSLENIFERLGCLPSVAEDLLTSWGFPPQTWSKPLSVDELREVRSHFSKNEEILERIIDAISTRKETALDYLAQEGLLDEAPWAIVDLGWHGSLQTALTSLLKERGGACQMGFYFGLQSRGTKGPENNECAAFLFDQDRNGDDVPVVDLVYLMESFCTAPDGSCIGYQETNRSLEPIFRNGHELALANWGLGLVHDAYNLYAQVLDVDLLRGVDWNTIKKPVVELLEEFSTNPGLNEAISWGQFPYENDQHASASAPLAKPKDANLKSILHCMEIGALPHTFIEWKGGAWRQTKPTARRILETACYIGRVKGWLSRVTRS
jgi:FMN phosphatase YigB (HAD superfamily)